MKVNNFKIVISEMVRAIAEMCGDHLPLNGVNAKIALYDLDILFED